MRRRRDAICMATSGGSVPQSYMEKLVNLAHTSSALQLEVDKEIDHSHVCVDQGGKEVIVNGVSFEMVILATGIVTAPFASSLYRAVEEEFEAPTLDGLPYVDSSLRWLPNENLFVLGANAGLELGPGSGN